MKGRNVTVARKRHTMLGMLVESIPHHESKHIALYSFTGNMYGGRVMLPDAGGRGTDKPVFARAEETEQRCLYVNRNRPGYKKVLKTAVLLDKIPKGMLRSLYESFADEYETGQNVAYYTENCPDLTKEQKCHLLWLVLIPEVMWARGLDMEEACNDAGKALKEVLEEVL